MKTNERSATTVTLPSDREIVITRTFDAPRALVWQTWTRAEHLARWWSPPGWELPVCEVDLRVDGVWRYCMRGPNGENACGMAIYREIVEPERLVYTDLFTDSDGQPIEGMPEAQITVQFTEHAGRTTVTSTTLYESAEQRDQVLQMGAEEGIRQTLDKLAALLGHLQGR